MSHYTTHHKLIHRILRNRFRNYPNNRLRIQRCTLNNRWNIQHCILSSHQHSRTHIRYTHQHSRNYKWNSWSGTRCRTRYRC